MGCPKGHLSPLMNLLGLSQFGGWSSWLVGGKRRLFPYLEGSVPRDPEFFKPQRDWSCTWVLTGPQDGGWKGPQAPGTGVLFVALAKSRSPASRGPAQFRECGRVETAGPSQSDKPGLTS